MQKRTCRKRSRSRRGGAGGLMQLVSHPQPRHRGGAGGLMQLVSHPQPRHRGGAGGLMQLGNMTVRNQKAGKRSRSRRGGAGGLMQLVAY